jgi:protein-disulfide isomerase
LLEKYPGKIKIFFKNFPISAHKFAQQAAVAALAADRQGKFEKFHFTLFENYNKLSEDKIQEIGKSLGLDMERFNKDVKDPAISRLIDRDRAEGEQIGIRAVPSLFINGKFFSRTSNLYQMIEDEIKPDN